jgi:hypothetical protein
MGGGINKRIEYRIQFLLPFQLLYRFQGRPSNASPMQMATTLTTQKKPVYRKSNIRVLSNGTSNSNSTATATVSGDSKGRGQ